MSVESRAIIEHLMDIKSELAEIRIQLSDYPEVKEAVKQTSQEILRAKASVNTLRWLGGIFLISVPAAIAACIKIFKG